MAHSTMHTRTRCSRAVNRRITSCRGSSGGGGREAGKGEGGGEGGRKINTTYTGGVCGCPYLQQGGLYPLLRRECRCGTAHGLPAHEPQVTHYVSFISAVRVGL